MPIFILLNFIWKVISSNHLNQRMTYDPGEYETPFLLGEEWGFF